MPRLLIVNADDLGADVRRNDGILEAHVRGVVTSATLLVTLPGAEDAAKRLKLSPFLGVGLHLNLSEGRPASRGLKTLVGPDGGFWGKGEIRRRLRGGMVDPAEIRREIGEQLGRMADLGLAPDHVDGHHHIQVYPGVIVPLAEAMKERGIRWVRLPAELVGSAGEMAAERRASLAEYAALTPSARKTALDQGLRAPAGFLGVALTGSLSAQGILEALPKAPEGASELMVHPGYADPEKGGFSGAEREAELSVLTDPALREGIARLGFRLTSFRDLP